MPFLPKHLMPFPFTKRSWLAVIDTARALLVFYSGEKFVSTNVGK